MLFWCSEAFLRKLTKYLLLRTKKNFFYEYEPHTAKPSFSGVLKHFYGNSQKISFYGQKIVFFPQNEPHLKYAILVF